MFGALDLAFYIQDRLEKDSLAVVDTSDDAIDIVSLDFLNKLRESQVEVVKFNDLRKFIDAQVLASKVMGMSHPAIRYLSSSAIKDYDYCVKAHSKLPICFAKYKSDFCNEATYDIMEAKDSRVSVPWGITCVDFNSEAVIDELYLPDTVFFSDNTPRTVNLHNSKVKNIRLPWGMSVIPARQFAKLPCLERIVIPDTVTHIDLYAFMGSTSLKEVVLPKSLQTVEDGVFQDTQIKRIVFPESTTTVGNSAFARDTALETIEFKGDTVNLGHKIIEGTAVRRFVFPKKEAFVNTKVCMGAEYLEEVVLPDTVTGIGDSAFEDCRSLEKINIPSAVNIILDAAFAGCSNLRKLDLYDTQIEELNRDSFAYSGIRYIALPHKCKYVYKYCFKLTDAIEVIYIPKTVKAFADWVARTPFDCVFYTDYTEADLSRIPIFKYRNVYYNVSIDTFRKQFL